MGCAFKQLDVRFARFIASEFRFLADIATFRERHQLERRTLNDRIKAHRLGQNYWLYIVTDRKAEPSD